MYAREKAGKTNDQKPMFQELQKMELLGRK